MLLNIFLCVCIIELYAHRFGPRFRPRGREVQDSEGKLTVIFSMKIVFKKCYEGDVNLPTLSYTSLN